MVAVRCTVTCAVLHCSSIRMRMVLNKDIVVLFFLCTLCVLSRYAINMYVLCTTCAQISKDFWLK